MKLLKSILSLMGLGIKENSNHHLNPINKIKQTSIDSEPDFPISFGYKISWLAIKANDTDWVLSKLPIRDKQVVNWRSGLDYAYEHGNHAFVTPVIHGWVLVVGNSIWQISDISIRDKYQYALDNLPTIFDEVHIYGTYRVADYIIWQKAKHGQWQRLYSNNEYGIFTMGAITAEETALGLPDYDGMDDSEALEKYWQLSNKSELPIFGADEEDVMKIAQSWSINPNMIDAYNKEKSTGWLVKIDWQNTNEI